MPEEINRLATDAVADVLWTPSPDADAQPARRGRAGRADHPRRQHHARQLRDDARRRSRRPACPRELGLDGARLWRRHAAPARPMSTIRRSSPRSSAAWSRSSAQLPVVFPVHPRTAARLGRPASTRALGAAGVRLIEPLALCPLHEPGRRRRARWSPTPAACRRRPPISASPASPCATTPSGRSPSSRAPTASSRRRARRRRLLDGGARHKPGRAAAPEYWDGKTAGRCLDDLQAPLRARPSAGESARRRLNPETALSVTAGAKARFRLQPFCCGFAMNVPNQRETAVFRLAERATFGLALPQNIKRPLGRD